MAATINKSFVGPPVTTCYVERTLEDRASVGILTGLISYLTRIESVENLLADLE